MKKNVSFRRGQGFTLVELLVVIAIVAVLATVVFMFARKGMSKATSARSLSRMRESGTILLADAQDKNGKFQYAVEAEPADSEFLPYNIVRKSLGLDYTGPQSASGLCSIMHWDATKLKPTVYQQNCLGVNFTIIPNDPEGFAVTWTDEDLSAASGTVKVRTLVAATVTRPEFYPILLDSSNAKGEEYFAIREGDGGYVGLRNDGKANGYFMDGSARELGLAELKNAGFNKAYDNSTNPPTLKTLK